MTDEPTDSKGMRPLGDFECAVLLAVARLDQTAYGISIRTELTARLGRDISIGAIYTTLERLRKKGLVTAVHGEPTPERGGRAKKFYAIEDLGLAALDHTRRASEAVWGMDLSPQTT